MNLLAFDTSTEACAVGVSVCDRHYGRFALTPRQHAECVLPWSEQLLAQADVNTAGLQAIGVGVGPGAFTGVRLAVSLAQGMALALGIPVVPVSTLAVIAQAQDHDGPIAVVMDARMGECYVGFYQKHGGLVEALAPECLLPPDALQLPFSGNWIGVGSAFSAHAAVLPASLMAALCRIDAAALPQPHALLQLCMHGLASGLGQMPEHVAPTYLREKVALTLEERMAATVPRE